MNSITYIGEISMKGNHSGGKARRDVNMIFLDELGISNYGYKVRRFNNIFEKIMYVMNIHNICMLKKLFFLSNKRLFIQYPFGVNFILKNDLKHVIKNNKVVLLIHDIDSLFMSEVKIEEELKILNCCQACIVHNKYMAEYLKKMA